MSDSQSLRSTCSLRSNVVRTHSPHRLAPYLHLSQAHPSTPYRCGAGLKHHVLLRCSLSWGSDLLLRVATWKYLSIYFSTQYILGGEACSGKKQAEKASTLVYSLLCTSKYSARCKIPTTYVRSST